MHPVFPALCLLLLAPELILLVLLQVLRLGLLDLLPLLTPRLMLTQYQVVLAVLAQVAQ
jgi:hypothetical protein